MKFIAVFFLVWGLAYVFTGGNPPRLASDAVYNGSTTARG